MHADALPCCLASVRAAAVAQGMQLPLPALDDEEGAWLPKELPPVVDAHVHVFPDKLFQAIWAWFDEHGWPVRYKLTADDVIRFVRSRGVQHVVLLHYAHKPGIARSMNTFVADLVARHEGVTGLATVHAADPDGPELLDEAFARGLAGIKLHCHVQAMPADDARLWPIYELCAARGKPVVIHAGRAPRPPPGSLAVEPDDVCDASRIERVLRAFPALRVVVPHLGADELDAYADLLKRFDNLWLDTTMMLGGYFATGDVHPWVAARPDRVIFGTDFPNLPYAWDREARAVAAWTRQARLRTGAVEALVGGNAREVFGLR